MPTIRSSADLRNNYNEEAYEQLTSRFELYSLIQEGLTEAESGQLLPFSDTITEIRKQYP